MHCRFVNQGRKYFLSLVINSEIFFTALFTDKAGEHQRQRRGGREARRGTWPHLDHHPVLPGSRIFLHYTKYFKFTYNLLILYLTVAMQRSDGGESYKKHDR